jgi:prevent-host-death family protein
MKVKISVLKAKLSAYLKRAKNGEEIIIYDRDHPIARITGISQSPLTFRPPTDPRPPSELELPRWPRSKSKKDPVDYLLEDRRRDRVPR